MTIKEIAKKAGVSIATVSYVLNGKKKVSNATKERILEIINTCGYKSNAAARTLKNKTNNLIALCLESLHGPFFSDLIDGIQDASVELNYNFIVATSYRNENSSAYKLLTERRVDSAIILAPTLSDEFLLSIANKNIPLIVLDRELKHDLIRSILLDNSSGIMDAISYAISTGAKKIAYINGINSHYDSQQRLIAFHKAMKHFELTIDNKLIFQGNFKQDSGEQIAYQMLASLENLPDVVLCANDEMAIGLMQTLQKNGIKIPEQISIIGFDDITLTQYIQPNLSTISHQKYDLGVIAMHRLTQLFNQQPIDNLYLKTNYINRNSTK